MSPSEESAVSIEERLRSQAVVELSSRLEFVDLPCIEGEFVMMRSALRHPRLDRPLAFLSGWEMAPLLKQLHKGLTPFQVARSWSSHVPIESGLALVGWLIGHGIFVQKGFDIAEEGTRR